jgi:hypothetical protein
MPDHVEFPRPLRLLATISWSLTESAGLPAGALAVGPGCSAATQA